MIGPCLVRDWSVFGSDDAMRRLCVDIKLDELRSAVISLEEGELDGRSWCNKKSYWIIVAGWLGPTCITVLRERPKGARSALSLLLQGEMRHQNIVLTSSFAEHLSEHSYHIE